MIKSSRKCVQNLNYTTTQQFLKIRKRGIAVTVFFLRTNNDFFIGLILYSTLNKFCLCVDFINIETYIYHLILEHYVFSCLNVRISKSSLFTKYENCLNLYEMSMK